MRKVLVVCMLLAAQGCAVAPAPDPEMAQLASQARAHPEQRLTLMRQRSERLSGHPFVGGNSVALLVNGPASFAALAAAIDGARLRIDMESYEFDEVAGPQFADRLLAARRRGVAVNLIYDAWGAKGTPSDLFETLRQAGARVLEFNPLRPSARVALDLNRRDHRKLLCVDGRLVVTGGVNISRVYENRPGPQTENPDDEAWRDTDIRIEGPVAAEFERLFMQSWREQNGPQLDPPPPTPATRVGDTLVEAIEGAPRLGEPVIYRTMLDAITLAARSVHLTTGFFVPPPPLLRALQEAARRGVDVQIVVPGRSTSDAAIVAGRADYGRLLAAGVGIHERQRRILHAKTAVIDGDWSAVGSSNLDWRSTVWNNEIDALVLGPGFGGRMEAMFAADVAASKTVDLPGWRRRGLLERARELLALAVNTLL